MTDWKDWYFAKAKGRPSKDAVSLFWDVIKPGCSSKMMAQISQAVLDIEDPRLVDWRFLRPGHIWLRREDIDKRTAIAGMHNIKRLAAMGVQRRMHSWFHEQLGWVPKTNTLKQLEITHEADFLEIEKGAVEGLPRDLSTGVQAILRLMYYGGLTAHQAGSIKFEDLTYVDGRVLIYSRGLLLEVPDHVRFILMDWIRLRSTGRRVKTDGNSKIFRIDQYRVAVQFPKLPDTLRSIRRLRG